MAQQTNEHIVYNRNVVSLGFICNIVKQNNGSHSLKSLNTGLLGLQHSQQMWSLLLLSLSPQSTHPCGARLLVVSNVDKRVFIWSACSTSIMSQSASLATMWPKKAKNMVIAECSVSFNSILQLPFIFLSIFPWLFWQLINTCNPAQWVSRRAAGHNPWQPKGQLIPNIWYKLVLSVVSPWSWYRCGGRCLAACGIRLLKNHPHRVLSRMGGEQTVSFQHGGPLMPAVDPLLSNQTALVSYDANS